MSMHDDLMSAAGRLWHAPRWKAAVLGTGALTILLVFKTLLGSGDEPLPGLKRPEESTIPKDPASDARLAAFDTAYEKASTIKEAGARCEAIAAALSGLVPDDLKQGKNILASNKTRIRELAEGQRCQESLGASDAHFSALASAVAAATTNSSAAALQKVSGAYRALDAFDQSRPRFSSSDIALLNTAKGDVQALESSNARLEALIAAADKLTHDQSADASIAAAEALRHLTDLDLSHMSDRQRSAAATAESAAKSVRDSRGRFARLSEALTTAESARTSASQQLLLEATSSITPYDQDVATPEQRQVLATARDVAAPFAWAMLRDSLSKLENSGSAENYMAVSRLYRSLRTAPQSDLNEDQRRALAKAEEADAALAASDARLQALLDARRIWDQHHAQSESGILDALHGISPFDQARFTPDHKQAFETLARAEVVLRGPAIGLTSATKSRVPMFVRAAGSTPTDSNVADALRDSLRRSGFQIVPDRMNAAILVEVSIEKLEEPKSDFSGAFAMWVAEAQLNVDARWAADDSTLLNESKDAIGRTQSREQAKAQALLSAIALIADRFQALTSQPR